MTQVAIMASFPIRMHVLEANAVDIVVLMRSTVCTKLVDGEEQLPPTCRCYAGSGSVTSK